MLKAASAPLTLIGQRVPPARNPAMKHIELYLDLSRPTPIRSKAARGTEGHQLGDAQTGAVAALLKHHGQLGPPKLHQGLTYQSRGKPTHGVVPPSASHPFNPLGLLRLVVACDASGEPNRYVCETIFRHAWQVARTRPMRRA
jgi:hypothetical protein